MVKSELLSSIVTKLKAQYQAEKVILFGSHAWGTPDAESDLDLLIVKDTAQPRRERAREVRHILHEENTQTSMDILVMTPAEIQARLAMGDSFIARVMHEGAVLYG